MPAPSVASQMVDTLERTLCTSPGGRVTRVMCSANGWSAASTEAPRALCTLESVTNTMAEGAHRAIASVNRIGSSWHTSMQ